MSSASAAARYRAMLKAVAIELKLPADSDKVEHVATMRLARRAVLARLLRNDMLRTDPDDLLKLDAALKPYQPADEGLKVQVSFVETAVGIGFVNCPECGHRSEHRFGEGELAPLPPKPAPVEVPVAEVAPAAAASTANVVPILGSRLHYGSDNGGSNYMGAVYAPGSGANTAAALPFNDLNPNRKV